MIRAAWAGLRPFTTGMRTRIASTMLVAIISGTAEAGTLLITVRVAVSASGSADDPLTVPLFGGTLGTGTWLLIALLSGLVALVGHLFIARQIAALAADVLANTRSVAVRHYLAASWSTQSLQREGALQETVTTLSFRTSMLMQSLVAGLSQAVMASLFVVVAFAVDVVATAVVVAAGAVLAVLLLPAGRATQRRAREYVGVSTTYAEQVSRLTSNSMELRVFGAEHAAERELTHVLDSVRSAQFRARFASLAGGGLFKDLAVILLVACVAVMTALGQGAVGGVVVVLTLVLRALAAVQQVNSAFHSASENAPNLEALSARISHLAGGVFVAGTTPLNEMASIELDDVGYSYEADVRALSGVSFSIAPGESIGVIGPSGGGKSTLIQVLLRLRTPDQGVLRVNGADYVSYDEESWTRQLGFVPQEPGLIEGTVAENIAYYRDFTDSEIEWAARSSNIHDEIMALPAGYDTRLGPRGTGLSGGQKQRVAIARALVARPSFIVMDEPSSALDTKSERILTETIRTLKGSTTMVIVAHRMTTIESCDRLLVIQNGRIVQSGSVAELSGIAGFLKDVQNEGVR